MTGFEFLDWLEASPHRGKVRVCMLTTSVRPADQELALRYPEVIGYKEKPLSRGDFESLLARVND
jgi:CheY-like chemotaxis protein